MRGARQTSVLFRKAARLLILDPIGYLVRACMFVFATIFFTVIYIKCRNHEQDQLLNRLWLTMWLLGVTTSLGVVMIYLANTDYQIVKREVKDGMYHPLTYVIANSMLQLPMLSLLAVCMIFPALCARADVDTQSIQTLARHWHTPLQRCPPRCS